jgi:uncharacterized membrane protein
MRMTTLRMLVLTLLVIMVTSLPIATSVASASVLDSVEKFAQYLSQYYG